ncbi:MAG: DUF5996 family protein [Vulcanimicrobiaceae bacterium]
MAHSQWPVLPAPQAWAKTRHTVHMFAQIVGKVRMKLAPPEPEWNHVPLYVTSRGLSTSPIPNGSGSFQVDFDFIDHVLYAASSDGVVRKIDLPSHSVASFYAAFTNALRDLGVDVSISTLPSEVPNPVRFTDDAETAYERDHVDSWWQSLVVADSIFKEHRAPFRNRHTQVIFYWGSFDLSYSRYSGRPADPPPNADSITRVAMDAQEICVGFWPGDDRFPAAAFYCYAYPKPEGIESADAGPSGAHWNATVGEFVLPYDDARNAASPRAAVLDFLARTFDAGARLGAW